MGKSPIGGDRKKRPKGGKGKSRQGAWDYEKPKAGVKILFYHAQSKRGGSKGVGKSGTTNAIVPSRASHLRKLASLEGIKRGGKKREVRAK